jgi:hypothetical protein
MFSAVARLLLFEPLLNMSDINHSQFMQSVFNQNDPITIMQQEQVQRFYRVQHLH